MARMQVVAAAAGAALTALICGTAAAQFGYYGLPQNDFTWTWGDAERRSGVREDISAQGSEGKFRCELSAALRLGSRYSSTEVRQLEQDLRVSLDFVRAASQLMNVLDAQRELDWGVLACTTPQPQEVTEEQRAERESKARERMQREVERRRARRAERD